MSIQKRIDEWVKHHTNDWMHIEVSKVSRHDDIFEVRLFMPYDPGSHALFYLRVAPLLNEDRYVVLPYVSDIPVFLMSMEWFVKLRVWRDEILAVADDLEKRLGS